MPTHEHDVVIDRLSKRYGSTLAVDQLSFTANPGRVTGFLGPNGAGKTTTLRLLLGLARPTGGTALIGGRPLRLLPTPARTVGALLDTRVGHPGRRVRTHLEIAATVVGVTPTRVSQVLADVDLVGVQRRRIGALSLGMRQRLGLAVALLGDPSVLILDEPFNGLDPSGVRWLRDLLRKAAQRGATVLLSSHLLSEITLVADDIVIVADGRRRASGALSEFGNLEETFLAITSHEEDGCDS